MSVSNFRLICICDCRVKGTIIEGLGRCIILIVSGGGGWYFTRTTWERLDKMEESQAEIK